MPAPTKRGKRCVPPNPGVIPSPVSGWAKRALLEAIRISQAIANSQPPPNAKPLTAAMTGQREIFNTREDLISETAIRCGFIRILILHFRNIRTGHEALFLRHR